MRIALFTDTCLPQLNGVSRTLARLVSHLEHRGHDVALVSPRVGTAANPSRVTLPEAPIEPSLHLRLGGIPFPLYPELLLTRPPAAPEFRALEYFNPDVVHCATESMIGWGGRGWALRTHRPLVTSFHTNFAEYVPGYLPGVFTPLAWSLLRRFHSPAVRTLCPTPTTRSDLQTRGFHPRISLWSRGVDADRFDPGRRSEALRDQVAPGAEVVLLYVGRLAAEKRITDLISAFRILRESTRQQLGLVLVGDGPLRSRIQREAGPGVHLTGFRTGAALLDLYASADLFAFPSETETFGNVVIEAMASGLPVVGVDRGGVRDLIRPGITGFLAPPRDPERLAEAILPLVESRELRARMALAAREDALGHNWERILDGVIVEYEAARLGSVGRMPRAGVPLS